MAINNFLTDKFTTLGGLAAVAYGSSLSFGSVGDEIKKRSITKSLDKQLPSNVLLDFLGTKTVLLDVFKAVFQAEYDKLTPFTDFIDIHSSIAKFSSLCTESFFNNLNVQSTYSVSTLEIIERSITESFLREGGSEEIGVDIQSLTNNVIVKIQNLERVGQDVEKLVTLISNNPNTKITAAIPDTTVSLPSELSLEKDSRGVDRKYGTIPPRDYFSGVGFVTDGDSIRKSALQGYVGYPLFSLLGESLLNPDSYNNLNLSDTSVSVLSQLNNNPGIPASEQGIYNLNLARIDLGT